MLILFFFSRNPTPNSSDPVLGNFKWPIVNNTETLEYININHTLTVEKGPKRYKVVKDLYEKYVKPPYYVF